MIFVVSTEKDLDVVIFEVFGSGEVIVVEFRGFKGNLFLGGLEIIDADSVSMNETGKGTDLDNEIERGFTVET